MAPLRWGIASAGKICHDFCVGLSTLPASDHRIAAVAARQKARAEEFAKKHEIPVALGSYEELAKSTHVDIVYIGVLNPQHYEVAKLMLDHGKHVLCEKPLCMNQKQAKKLLQYAESRKLFLMEAVWSRFFPAYQHVRQQIDSGALGEIQSVDVTFGFELTDVDRLQKKDLGGGTILDLGIYTTQVSQWALRDAPERIVAKGELNAEGVDVHVEAELFYSRGRRARMTLSSKQTLTNVAIIKGSKGQISIPHFWSPTKIIDIDGKEREWSLPKGKYATNFANSEGLRYEAEAVRQSLLANELENKNVTHNESLVLAHIEDEIRRQVGVIFDADTE